DVLEGRRSTWAYRLDPEGLSRQHSVSLVHGFDWAHTLNKNSFYNLSVRQNYLDYKDRAYDDLYDARYDSAGAPAGDANFQDGAIIQGVDFTRFAQRTNALVLKGALVNQVTRDHQLKGGAEWQWPWMSFGNMGYLVETTVNGQRALVRHVDEPPNYPGVRWYHPYGGAADLQADAEWDDLCLRAGLVFEYCDARSALPCAMAEPCRLR